MSEHKVLWQGVVAEQFLSDEPFRRAAFARFRRMVTDEVPADRVHFRIWRDPDFPHAVRVAASNFPTRLVGDITNPNRKEPIPA